MPLQPHPKGKHPYSAQGILCIGPPSSSHPRDKNDISINAYVYVGICLSIATHVEAIKQTWRPYIPSPSHPLHPRPGKAIFKNLARRARGSEDEEA